MENVKLFGTLPSPFSYRVIWVLELKGIKYDYIEEDLANKSSLLLQYNPVHKKIPVLVHNEKPICESLVILEYVEEIWPHQHPLLPKEPYERAMVRFWAKFADEKGIVIWILFRTTGEDQAKAKKECFNMLETLEEHGNLGTNTFFGGENVGLADLAVASVIHWLEVIEQVLEIKLFEGTTFPSLYNWFNNLKDVPIIKSNIPDQHQMFLSFKKQRETLMDSTAT
ncbi:glutathione transferase GST 23-like [Chenopodium quinoa]|uniref:glutathione transferase n=1 Tax=Chenopodium quinoa TaxID=63459 RepID=A0A803MUB4_CHEQI|nr:glutathione transferase GST 23-like [Chenopodium quinoa]